MADIESSLDGEMIMNSVALASGTDPVTVNKVILAFGLYLARLGLSQVCFEDAKDEDEGVIFNLLFLP